MKPGLNRQPLVSAAIGIISLLLAVLALSGVRAQSSPAAAQPDYQRAVYDPIHFKPAIDQATNAQCLACHAEVLKPSVRAESPAGVKAASAKAWYQQTSVYSGEQDTFHRRHLETPLAKEIGRAHV